MHQKLRTRFGICPDVRIVLWQQIQANENSVAESKHLIRGLFYQKNAQSIHRLFYKKKCTKHTNVSIS